MSALKPYSGKAENDSREKLEEDVRKWCERSLAIFPEARERIIYEWLDRQAAITEREVLDRRIKMKPRLVDVYDDGTFEITAEYIAIPTSDAKAKIAELQAKVDDLQARLDMAHETIDGLRASLDETIAERNELVRCLEADCGMRASWDGQRNCWTIEATSEHMDARRELLAKLSEIECTWMPLPVDADGVPIRFGDTVEASGIVGKVASIDVRDNGLAYIGIRPMGWDVSSVYGADECRHAPLDTVESLLLDFQQNALITRGQYANNAIEVDEMRNKLNKSIEEYAERIRKAVE